MHNIAGRQQHKQAFPTGSYVSYAAVRRSIKNAKWRGQFAFASSELAQHIDNVGLCEEEANMSIMARNSLHHVFYERQWGPRSLKWPAKATISSLWDRVDSLPNLLACNAKRVEL
jgi:hypothetical protein